MRLNRTIEDVVCFAKKIPGFAELDQDDQISLIKGGCFEVCFYVNLFDQQFEPITFRKWKFISIEFF